MYMPGHYYALLEDVRGLLPVACRSSNVQHKAKRGALRLAEPCRYQYLATQKKRKYADTPGMNRMIIGAR